jgi:outer membrane protein assembly factor BamA
VYTFRPGLWVTGGLGYGYGGESTIDGDKKDDTIDNIAFSAALGVPINRRLGVKLGYLGMRTQNNTGRDLDNLTLAMSVLW